MEEKAWPVLGATTDEPYSAAWLTDCAAGW